jgi:type VI secretion system protein ImpK
MTGFHPNFPEPTIALRETSLAELYADILALSRILESAIDLGDPARIRTQIEEELKRVEAQVAKAGQPHRVQDARFPLIALLDEMILRNKHWQQKQDWLDRPLQWDFYATRNAGEEFFERLDQLRQRGDENLPLIELYYQCLAVGFEGKYFDPAERERLITSVSKDLMRAHAWTPEELAPHWLRPQERRLPPPPRVRTWIPIAVSVFVAILLILLFHNLAGDHAARIERARNGLRAAALGSGGGDSWGVG